MTGESESSVPSHREVIQLALTGLGQQAGSNPQKTRRPRTICQTASISEDTLVPTYLRRLAARGAAAEGVAAYHYQLRWVLRAAVRLADRDATIGDLFADSALLGQVLVDDLAEGRAARLSKWTLAQRRSAIRSIATLMRPELLLLLGEDPHAVLDRALRDVAERVGSGYRLTGGEPRRRGGHSPTPSHIAAVIAEAGRAPGFLGARNRAFFGILAATGTRVNALRQLDGADCVVVPSGRLRLFLREKGKAERREVELSRDLAADLSDYIEAFNRHPSRGRRLGRIELGTPGAVWRNSGRGRWPEHDVRVTLRAACASAGVPEFTPHALRRAFATDAASRLPRHVVALAGGWQGIERLDDHYVRPRQSTIWHKLHGGETRAEDEPVGSVVRETAPAL